MIFRHFLLDTTEIANELHERSLSPYKWDEFYDFNTDSISKTITDIL